MGRPSKYPAEFRQEAVRLALVSDESRAGVARRLGINETTLRNWVADHLSEEARGSDPLVRAQVRGPLSASAETMRAHRFGELAHSQA
jgi:transposase-like protein